MNIYYAIGGGLGHLTRARAFLHQQQIESETAILTSSKYAADKRVVGDIRIITVEEGFSCDKQNYREFLRKNLVNNSVDKIFFDSFPVGVVGEFSGFDFPQSEIFYVARRLKWKNYADFLNECGPRFKKTFVLEPLEKEHRMFVDAHSEVVIDLDLIYPNLESHDEKAIQLIVNGHSPFWLVVHAGSAEEIDDLIGFANEMREIERAAVTLVLVSPNDHAYENRFDIYPASALFLHAERIFTACGFNAMKQTEEFRHKHFFLPFARRYDDQFKRAERA